MVRETRGSAAARDTTTMQPPQSSPDNDSSSKRKRRTSTDTAASNTNASANGEQHPDSKRPRTSVNGKGTDTVDEETDVSERPGRLLTKEIREAIAIVISQMAAGLPSPINKLLTLWLPPDFTQKDENTLGWILKQDSLTWEKLVSTLHLFSEHLLLPCAYPNPVPSLARIHLPVPPLPSHFAPLTVYSFCRALYHLLLQVEAQIDEAAPVVPTGTQERWALMQKTPGHGLGTAGGEWFTTAADLREVEAARKKLKLKNGDTLLSALAAGGDKFGNAQPLIVQATEPLGSEGKGNVPTLSDSLIRRASLKAQRWKDSLAARRRSGFGSVLHSVTIPRVSAAPFTPTFGPQYDSLSATGLGYYSTLDLMHERRRRHLHTAVTAKIVEMNEDDGYVGVINEEEGSTEEKAQEKKAAGDSDTTDAILAANAGRIEELQAWQELRVIRGDAEWVSDRERALADELFASLAQLVESSDTPPSALLPKNLEPGSLGLAHTLARRLLANRAPIIRGTLDPRRPQALHDNVTIRLRAQAAAAIVAPSSAQGVNGSMSAPHAPPPKASPGTPGYMPPPSSTLREPPPHTLPSSARYYSHGRAPYPVPSQQPQKSPHQMHQPLSGHQQHQALPTHQTMQTHHQAIQSHHALQSHQQALQAHQAQQALQTHQAMQSQHQAMQAHQIPNVPMVPSGSPAHAQMRTAGMMGMSNMPQAYIHQSPGGMQQVFRPPTTGQAHMMHQQNMATAYTRTQLPAGATMSPGMTGSASPSPMGAGYPHQRMVSVMGPSGLRQTYAMAAPGTPGTPGTPGGMPMAMYAQQSYGSPMPMRVQGMPGVPMMGTQVQGQMPGQQVQMHR